jgi:holo-[acyl-carrier protein] synthase
MTSDLLIGIDMERISRVNELVNTDDKFLTKIFTKEELKLSKFQLAGNFSGKEATIKALYPIKKLSFQNIEILRDEFGRPYVKVQDYSLNHHYQIDISITTLEDFVTAVVIARRFQN